jgi:hypothetical protein
MVDEKQKKQEADKIVSKLEELYNNQTEIVTQEKERSTGLGVNLNSGEKKIEYLRVPEMGSVEAYKLDNGDWAVKRRDKLNY